MACGSDGSWPLTPRHWAWGSSPRPWVISWQPLLPALITPPPNTSQVYLHIAGPRLSQRPGLPSTLPSTSTCLNSGLSPLLSDGSCRHPHPFVVVFSSSLTPLSL